MAPAMWQWATHHQMHVPRQWRGRAQVVAIAVDIPAQLIAVRWVTMLLVRRAVMVLMLPRRWLTMHFTLVLPQPLALSLWASLLVPRRVAVLRLFMVMRVFVILAVLMCLAGSMRRRSCARS